MSKIISSVSCAMVAAVWLVAPASAATFSYSAEVESLTATSTTPGNPVVAPVGSPGTVTFDIDDSNPLLPIFDPDPVSGVFTASVSVPGYFQGDATFVDVLSSFSVTDSYLQFTTYGDTSYVDTGSFPITVPDGYHTFRIDFGTPLAAAPVTVGDVVAGLTAPGAVGFFRHEIVLINPATDTTAVVQTRVAFEDNVPEVPLPAAGWLLLAGVTALRVAKRWR